MRAAPTTEQHIIRFVDCQKLNTVMQNHFLEKDLYILTNDGRRIFVDRFLTTKEVDWYVAALSHSLTHTCCKITDK